MADDTLCCETCPYGIESYESRFENFGEDYQPEYCWCDKVGGKHYAFGYCSECDSYENFVTNDSIGKDKPNKRTIAYRRERHRLKDKRLRKIINQGGYAPHIGYIDWDWANGKWQEVGTHIKYPRNSNCQKWIKKMTSKKFRHSDIGNGNSYRRLVDYWWIMY